MTWEVIRTEHEQSVEESQIKQRHGHRGLLGAVGGGSGERPEAVSGHGQNQAWGTAQDKRRGVTKGSLTSAARSGRRARLGQVQDQSAGTIA